MKVLRKLLCLAAALLLSALAGCSGVKKDKLSEWLSKAELSDSYTADELYKAALNEGTLVVYSVSSRAFQTKEAFEKEYPGLSVEVKDIRSNDIVDMLKDNYKSGNYLCDVVICSDCDGSLYKELIEPRIIYSYVPWDIAPKLKEKGEALDFLGEAMMLFYNSEVYSGSPIGNIWELTEEQYRGRIMMSSPLSSFSTYGFCAQSLAESEALEKAYEKWAGRPLEKSSERSAGMVFWEMLAPNLVFVNSNDEVLEGVGNSSDTWFGLMISSKLRYRDLGYHFEPIKRLEPFSCVYTPNCLALAAGSGNINAAKLFIRYTLGEADGASAGAAAFSTEGSWSARTDMPDGSSIPREELDMCSPDKDYLYENKDKITEFFGKLLEENIN